MTIIVYQAPGFQRNSQARRTDLEYSALLYDKASSSRQQRLTNSAPSSLKVDGCDGHPLVILTVVFDTDQPSSAKSRRACHQRAAAHVRPKATIAKQEQAYRWGLPDPVVTVLRTCD